MVWVGGRCSLGVEVGFEGMAWGYEYQNNKLK